MWLLSLSSSLRSIVTCNVVVCGPGSACLWIVMSNLVIMNAKQNIVLTWQPRGYIFNVHHNHLRLLCWLCSFNRLMVSTVLFQQVLVIIRTTFLLSSSSIHCCSIFAVVVITNTAVIVIFIFYVHSVHCCSIGAIVVEPWEEGFDCVGIIRF